MVFSSVSLGLLSTLTLSTPPSTAFPKRKSRALELLIPKKKQKNTPLSERITRMILHKVLLLKIDYNFIPTDYEVIFFNHYIKILKYFNVVPRHFSIKAYEILKK